MSEKVGWHEDGDWRIEWDTERGPLTPEAIEAEEHPELYEWQDDEVEEVEEEVAQRPL